MKKMTAPSKKSLLNAKVRNPKGREVKSILKKVGLYDLLSESERDDIDLKLEDPYSIRDFDRLMDPNFDKKQEKSLAIEQFRKRFR